MNNDQRLIQGTPEWLEFRRTMIMASDSPIIMGVSPWKTPLQLYHEKVDGVVSLKSSSMQRGHDLEDEAREFFEKLTGHFIAPKVIIDTDGWLGASLDGINDEGILVEIKCVNKKDHEMALDGKIPEKYYPQLQHQMYVCRLPQMFYFSYSPNHKETWAIVKVKRDIEYIAKLMGKLHKFYQCIVNKTPPDENL